MKKINKILTILLIILFPIGMLYCIGKNLFSRNFTSFLGGICLLVAGFLLCVFLLRPDIVEPIFEFFRNL